MTGQRNRPAGDRAVPEAFRGATEILPIEQAHLFGVGVSQTERRALARRGLAQLRDVLPDLVEQLARRCVQQAIEESLPTYWLARAERLEEVGTPWADEAAVACRRHGWLLATAGLPADLEAELTEGLELVGGEGR